MNLANLRLKWSIKSIHALYQHIFNVFKLHFLPWTNRNAEELDEYKTAATIKSPTATVFEKQKLKKHSELFPSGMAMIENTFRSVISLIKSNTRPNGSSYIKNQTDIKSQIDTFWKRFDDTF